MKKPILSKGMMKGYTPETSRTYERKTDDEAVHYMEIWEKKGTNAFIMLSIYEYKRKKDAKRYFNFKKRPGWKTTGFVNKKLGERYCYIIFRDLNRKTNKAGTHLYLNPVGFLFIKNNIVVSISGNGPYGDQQTDEPLIVKEIATVIDSKL